MFRAFIAAAVLGLLEVDAQGVERMIRRLRRTIVPAVFAVFLLDMIMPLGVAVPMLYAVPVFLAGLLWSLEWSGGVALLATILTYAGYFLSPEGGESHFGNVNRLMASVLLWLSLLVGWLLSHIYEEIKAFHDQQEK